MRKAAIYLILLMGLGIVFPSCSKTSIEDFPIMEDFYAESVNLPSVTADSVNHFKIKFNGFVAANPSAKQHSKYQPIMDNIQAASLRIILTIDTAWLGDTTVYFSRTMNN